MINLGFVKVAAAIPNVKVANCKYNIERILGLIEEAEKNHVKILEFPELSISGYTCADLFYQQLLIEQSENALKELLAATANKDMVFIVGMPISYNSRLFNTAVVCQKGKILGVVPKSYLPNTNEFYEKRWFSSGSEIPATTSINIAGQNTLFGTKLLFAYGDVKFAVEICEDLWLAQAPTFTHALNGAVLLFNLSASNEVIGKDAYRKQLVAQQSGKCVAAYIYAGSGFGESSTDLVFSGTAMIFENGSCLAESKRFQLEEQLIVADVDIQRLIADRRKKRKRSCSAAL